MDLLELRSSGWRRSGPLQQRKVIVAESLDAFRSTEEYRTASMRGERKMQQKRKKKKKTKVIAKKVGFASVEGTI